MDSNWMMMVLPVQILMNVCIEQLAVSRIVQTQLEVLNAHVTKGFTLIWMPRHAEILTNVHWIRMTVSSFAVTLMEAMFVDAVNIISWRVMERVAKQLHAWTYPLLPMETSLVVPIHQQSPQPVTSLVILDMRFKGPLQLCVNLMVLGTQHHLSVFSNSVKS
jgi:hypothetical protein